MPNRSVAAPPTPWSKNLAKPQIDQSAYVHSFSNIIGDVKIGANVLVAPGTSIRADEGFPFSIGENTNIQDGVVIHGLEEGRVKGDDGQSYSVWVGQNTSITHMSLIHGPAYVGDNCFIGFRSTVFNAKVGDGCIVMMHALIQDVEIPAGKYIPSGAIITNQQQADRLPDVNDSDMQFATHVIGVNQDLKAGYKCSESKACIKPLQQDITRYSSSNGNGNGRDRSYAYSGSGSSLAPEVIEQVNQLLAQGYTIGSEHADKRHFRTSSWRSCSPISSSNPTEVIAALEACLQEHEGEYVRLLGIDAIAKRRVLEQIIQKPDGPVSQANNGTISVQSTTPTTPSYSSPSVASRSGLNNLSPKISQLLAQGLKVGLEYADKRRFRTSSWRSGPSMDSTRAADVVSQVEGFLGQHSKEYVRLIGIDPQAQRRVIEEIIQRPDGKPVETASAAAASTYVSAPSPTSSVSSVATTNGSSNGDWADQVRSLLAQGYKIGTEHADKRRFRTSSWRSCSPIDSTRDAEVIAALEACMQEHSGEYVRMIGIDTQAKRRVLEQIIQQPK